MELSSFQRLVSFAAIVIVLAGLVVYLFLPSISGASGSPGRASRGARSAPARGPSGSPPTGPPAQSVSPGPGQVPDIYQWLPFTQAGLASAAEVTVKFGDDYGTYTYTEPVASYLAPMRPLITSQLAGVLGRAYATPGLVAARASAKQASKASAAVLSLRAFSPTSLTFVVAITERISAGSGGGTSQQVLDYAVTLTGSGTVWQVSDIEPASAGNQ